MPMMGPVFRELQMYMAQERRNHRWKTALEEALSAPQPQRLQALENFHKNLAAELAAAEKTVRKNPFNRAACAEDLRLMRDHAIFFLAVTEHLIAREKPASAVISPLDRFLRRP